MVDYLPFVVFHPRSCSEKIFCSVTDGHEDDDKGDTSDANEESNDL